MSAQRQETIRTLADAVSFVVRARNELCRECGGGPLPLLLAFSPSPGLENLDAGATLYMRHRDDDFPAGVQFIGLRRSPFGTRNVPMHTTDEQLAADAREAFSGLPILALGPLGVIAGSPGWKPREVLA